MRLYAVALVTWTATVIASSESNVANFSDHQAVDYAEFRDLPKQIVQPYVRRGTRAKNSGRTSVEVHPDDVAWREVGASTTDFSAPVSIYATPLETTGELSFRQQISNEAAYVVPEDVLLVENAGSFGQRVRQGKKATVSIGITEEYASIRDSSNSNVSLVKDESKHEVQGPIQEPFALSLKRESDTFRDDSPFNGTRAIESTESVSPNSNVTTDDDGTMGNTPGAQTDTVSVLENDVASEQLPRPRARSSRAHNGTYEKNTAKKSTRTVEKPEKTTSTTSVEISPSLQLTRFSGPIVVADLSGRESQNVADDYADDASLEVLRSIEKTDASLRTNVRGLKAAATAPAISNSITTSSIMLSPLQVGITLKNADEAGVVDNNEEFAATETKGYLQDDTRHLAAANKEESKGNEPSESYAKEGKPVEDVTRKTLGNSVEIQKSIELYHTAPVHEIHYPVEYVHRTSHLGVIETNNIGGAQKSKLPYGQDERSDLRPSYDAYRGNNVEKSVEPASAISPSFHRQEYNALEDGSIGAEPTQTTIAEYTSPSTSLETNLEQRPPLRYTDAGPVLLLANQYGEDALYEQSNVRHSLDGSNNDAPLHSGKVVTGGGTRQQQETISEFAKPYATNLYREQQQPPLNQQRLTSESRHPFRSPPEARRPEAPQLLLKIIPNSASPETGFLVPIPRPYPIEKIVEKTVHVPHPIEIEKVIERKVPFPVERVIEKQVQVPVPVPVLQPYPVHVHVPLEKARPPHVYPIHVERLIERRVPYTVQRLVVQPLPAYSSQTRLPGEKIADKPATGSARLSWPYRAETIDHGPTNVALETVKFGKFGNQPRTHEPPFTGIGDGASPFEPRQASSQIANASHFYADSGYGGIPSTYLDYNVDGKGYVPAATAHLSNVKLVIVPKKIAAHRAPLRLAAQVPSLPLSSFKRQIVYNLLEKNRGAPLKDEYVGPVPPRRTVFTAQVKALPATKPSLYSSVTHAPTTTAALRRVRQPEYLGSFRQSKMEYGFKPPMVPSVQYDENTASKVEN